MDHRLVRVQFLIENAERVGDCLICSLTPSQVYANIKGYGKAHRYVWEVLKGPIAEGVFICHSCDTPRCINITHLFEGTPLANMLDKAAKGRQHLGGPPKWMTDEQILEAQALRNTGWTLTQLGERFGVNRRTVSRCLGEST